jgi:hypothetical protein
MTTQIDSTPTSPVRLPGFTYQRIDVEDVMISCAIKGAVLVLSALRGFFD